MPGLVSKDEADGDLEETESGVEEMFVYSLLSLEFSLLLQIGVFLYLSS